MISCKEGRLHGAHVCVGRQCGIVDEACNSRSNRGIRSITTKENIMSWRSSCKRSRVVPIHSRVASVGYIHVVSTRVADIGAVTIHDVATIGVVAMDVISIETAKRGVADLVVATRPTATGKSALAKEKKSLPGLGRSIWLQAKRRIIGPSSPGIHGDRRTKNARREPVEIRFGNAKNRATCVTQNNTAKKRA